MNLTEQLNRTRELAGLNESDNAKWGTKVDELVSRIRTYERAMEKILALSSNSKINEAQEIAKKALGDRKGLT